MYDAHFSSGIAVNLLVSSVSSQRLDRQKHALKVAKIGLVDKTSKSIQPFFRTLTAQFLSNKCTCTGYKTEDRRLSCAMLTKEPN